MARKRKPEHKAARYIIKHSSLNHEVSPRAFQVWLREGLIELVDAGNRRLAHVSAIARTVWENGKLSVLPKAAPTPSVKTNAEIVDQCYIYANNGQVRIDRVDRERFADWRLRFGVESADLMIAQFLTNRRDWDMRAQYGWA